MAKFGFLSVLEEEMDKHFTFDYAIDWNKKNHAVEVTFILEAQNQSAVETVDDKVKSAMMTSFLKIMCFFTIKQNQKLMKMIIW